MRALRAAHVDGKPCERRARVFRGDDKPALELTLWFCPLPIPGTEIHLMIRVEEETRSVATASRADGLRRLRLDELAAAVERAEERDQVGELGVGQLAVASSADLFLFAMPPFAMSLTASSSVATEPSWKYGGLFATLRRLGGLNAAQSSGLFVTFMRPTSTLSSARLRCRCRR